MENDAQERYFSVHRLMKDYRRLNSQLFVQRYIVVRYLKFINYCQNPSSSNRNRIVNIHMYVHWLCASIAWLLNTEWAEDISTQSNMHKYIYEYDHCFGSKWLMMTMPGKAILIGCKLLWTVYLTLTYLLIDFVTVQPSFKSI